MKTVTLLLLLLLLKHNPHHKHLLCYLKSIL